MKTEIKFNPRELNILSKMIVGEKIKDKRILNTLSLWGIAILHEDTGKEVLFNGIKIKSWYVSECSEFTVNGKVFRGVYFSGCFCPFVVRVM